MSDPFLGEIRLLAFNFAPSYWASCNGQTISITQNTALFALIGNTFGGNGTTTFCLPNLNGRVAIGNGSIGSNSYSMGQSGGEETHTLTTAEMPSHAHTATATTTLKASSSAANSPTPQNTVPASTGRSNLYQTGTPNVDHAASSATTSVTINANGSGSAHNNLQPYLVLEYCIALQGIFPPRP